MILVMITITRIVAGAADDNTAAGAADGAGAAPDESCNDIVFENYAPWGWGVLKVPHPHKKLKMATST